MSKKKIGRGGNAVVEALGDGTKRSITQTPDGPRVTRHQGGVSFPEDPAALGIKAVRRSVVGGGNDRITVEMSDGQAVDLTRRGDGSTDERIHLGGATYKRT
jgi:hypothetical protein